MRPGPSRSRAALATALGGHLPPKGARIGLLGGSFNPAHEGHRALSLEALKRLDLDQVWWLVSPQNPLKSADGMAPLERRLASARTWARHPQIRAAALETCLGTRFTADSLDALKTRFFGIRFVWLMGADNLIQLASWERWPQILNGMPVAVLDRAPYSIRATAAKAARRFAQARVSERHARRLAAMAPPAWTFLRQPLNAQSASRIRAQEESSRAAQSRAETEELNQEVQS